MIKLLQQQNKIMKYGLEHILENSIYNKTKINKYSFSKQQRFPTLKANYAIDYYDQPSPANKRSCSFGYGSKYDLFKIADKNPSPCQYGKVQIKKNKGQTFGVSRQKAINNSYINYKSTLGIPGSKYDIGIAGSKFRNTRNCFLISKNKFDHFIQETDNPEPGKYQTLDNITSSRSSNTKYLNSQRSVFGSQQRFKVPKPDNIVGPMTYNLRQTSISKTGAASAFEFAHSKRNTYVVDSIQKSISPGPIYYPT